jgi:hypothetical protein
MAMEILANDFQVPGPVTWIQILPMASTCIFLITLNQHLDFDNLDSTVDQLSMSPDRRSSGQMYPYEVLPELWNNPNYLCEMIEEKKYVFSFCHNVQTNLFIWFGS